MLVKISDLFVIQEKLDARIFEKHGTNRQATQEDRILALLVELGECANETRTFKYWSLSKPSPLEVIQEEFSDVVHFMLSLGIDVNIQVESVKVPQSVEPLSTLFLKAYKYTIDLLEDYNERTLLNIYETVFSIAQSLGINPLIIREEYLRKNRINHERQDNNY